MSRPLEELTEANLVSEGVLEFRNGKDFRDGTRLADGKRIAVGDQRGSLIAARILRTHEGIVDDAALEPGMWEAR